MSTIPPVPGASIARQAQQLLNVVAPLDYTAIVAHHPQAVEELRQALITLGLARERVDEPLANYASQAQPKSRSVAAQVDPALEKKRQLQRQMLETLGQAGFSERVGKVYDSSSQRKLIPLKDVAHRRGLPAFSLVVAPDCSPKPGVYGVFMNAQEVWSALLPPPADQYQWQVRERRRFSSVQEFTELVTLLSAGFPLP